MEQREGDEAFFGGIVTGIMTRSQPEMPTQDEIVAWLRSRHLSMWGHPFLLEKERPLVAAQWILEQMESFLEWRKTQ